MLADLEWMPCVVIGCRLGMDVIFVRELPPLPIKGSACVFDLSVLVLSVLTGRVFCWTEKGENKAE